MVAIAKGKCGFFHQLIMKLYGGARKRHEKGSEVNWYKKEEKSKRKKKKKSIITINKTVLICFQG